ncbi:hypothetical protein [Vreelandella sp. H-I2]
MSSDIVVAIVSIVPGACALIWNVWDYTKDKKPKLEMICPYSALITDEDIDTKQHKQVVCIQAKIANFRKAPLVPYWHTLKVRVLTTDGWKDDCKINSHSTPPILTNRHVQVEGYVGLGHIPYFSMHDITPITHESPYARLIPITVDSIPNLHNIREIEFQFNDSLKRLITVRSDLRIMNLPTKPE